MLASEMIIKLQKLVEQYGDRILWHEDSGCQAYSLSDVDYCEEDGDFQVK